MAAEEERPETVRWRRTSSGSRSSRVKEQGKGAGQKGGTGGNGGASVAESGLTDYVDDLLDPGIYLGTDWKNYLNSGALAGGVGGDGGHGGTGANGGDGGDGGDAAAAILNEGTLTLIDTVFAGR